MASPVNLPISEPVIPQVSYTVSPSHFPSITGFRPAGIEYAGFVTAGCLNNSSSAARTLNWLVKRNGTTIGSGSQSVPSNNKATLNASILFGNNKPAIGDIIEISLWCPESDSDIQLGRHAIGIIPIRIKPVNNPLKLLLKTSIKSIGNLMIGEIADIKYSNDPESEDLYPEILMWAEDTEE